MNEIKLFCPATIANVSCGFDVLGLCLDSTGDEMTIRKIPEKGVRISKIIGQDLPLEAEKNVAGVAVLALLKEVETTFGFEIEINKKTIISYHRSLLKNHLCVAAVKTNIPIKDVTMTNKACQIFSIPIKSNS